MRWKRTVFSIWLMLLFSCFWFPVDGRAALVAHWTFDEGSGSTQVVDTVGRLVGDLSATGASLVSSGKAGGALSLSKASSGYVTMGDVLRLGSGPYSFVVWVKTSSAEAITVVIARHEGGNPSGYHISINENGDYGLPGKAWFYNYYNGLEPISATSVNDDQWHQIIGVRGNGVVKIYVDGLPVENTQPDQGLTDPPSGTPFVVGGYFDGTIQSTYTGLIDDIQVYNHDLSDGEVQWLFDHPGQVLCTSAPSGLISWWRAEGDARDFWDGNHGAMQNGATFAAGKVGRAFFLDGDDDYVHTGTGANSINRIGGDISIAAWVKTDSVSDDFKFIAATRESSGDEKGWELLANQSSLGGQLVFQVDTGPSTGSRIGTSNIRDGQWHHVAGIRSGNKLYVYVDGLIETGLNQDNDGGTINSTAATFIGKTMSINDTSNARWNGLIDEVAVFSRALTADEVAAIYAAGSAGICAVKTIYLPLILKN